MKTLSKILSIAALSASFTASNLQAQTLGDVMKEAGIEKMLGTWVDADTNGKNFKLSYKWKIKNHAVEVSFKTQENTSSALIVFDQESEQVLQMGANSQGALGRGTWTAQDGGAVLDLTQTNADGEEVELKVTHKIVDKNSLTVGFEMQSTGDTGEISMVRPAKKQKAKKPKAE